MPAVGAGASPPSALGVDRVPDIGLTRGRMPTAEEGIARRPARRSDHTLGHDWGERRDDDVDDAVADIGEAHRGRGKPRVHERAGGRPYVDRPIEAVIRHDRRVRE